MLLWSLFGVLLVLLWVLWSGSLDDLWPPRSGEAPALRWIRACAQHPLRTSLALALGLLALLPRSADPRHRWQKEL